MFNSFDSFKLGYAYGRKRGAVELSERDILQRWPLVNADAFAQGMLDGLARDDWRLTQIREREAAT